MLGFILHHSMHRLLSIVDFHIVKYTISNYMTGQNDAIDSSMFFCVWICISHQSEFCKENRLKECKFTFAFSFFISCS